MSENDVGLPAGEQERPLGRGLEQVSHLFISRKTDGASSSGGPAVSSPRASALPDGASAGAVLQPARLSRDQLSALVGLDGGLEEGLRAIDARVPCHPYGEIDVLAVDRAGQLAIIDFDTVVNDGLLLRGFGHFDWATWNMPIVQRMYRAQAVDGSLPARLFLLAPQFSPVLRRVMRYIIRPRIHWVRYHPVEAPGGPGILFEPVVGELAE